MTTHSPQKISKFEEMVKPAMQKLLHLKADFKTLDLHRLNIHEVENELSLIEHEEHQVMLAWAKSTRKINPSLLSDVLHRRISLSPYLAYSLCKQFALTAQ